MNTELDLICPKCGKPIEVLTPMSATEPPANLLRVCPFCGTPAEPGTYILVSQEKTLVDEVKLSSEEQTGGIEQSRRRIGCQGDVMREKPTASVRSDSKRLNCGSCAIRVTASPAMKSEHLIRFLF